jgi:hypothetical protein
MIENSYEDEKLKKYRFLNDLQKDLVEIDKEENIDGIDKVMIRILALRKLNISIIP